MSVCVYVCVQAGGSVCSGVDVEGVRGELQVLRCLGQSFTRTLESSSQGRLQHSLLLALSALELLVNEPKHEAPWAVCGQGCVVRVLVAVQGTGDALTLAQHAAQHAPHAHITVSTRHNHRPPRPAPQ